MVEKKTVELPVIWNASSNNNKTQHKKQQYFHSNDLAFIQRWRLCKISTTSVDNESCTRLGMAARSFLVTLNIASICYPCNRCNYHLWGHNTEFLREMSSSIRFMCSHLTRQHRWSPCDHTENRSYKWCKPSCWMIRRCFTTFSESLKEFSRNSIISFFPTNRAIANITTDGLET